MTDPHDSTHPARRGPAVPARARRFPDLGRFWSLANLLTLSRIALLPPIAYLVYHGGPLLWLVALMLLAVATDFLDGRVARRMNTVSEWGKVLDPLADKLAAAVVCVVLVVRPVEPTLELWFVALVVARDVIIASGGILQTRRAGFVLMALWSGKVAVNLLALTVIAVLLALPQALIDLLTWATALVLLYSLVRYLHRFVQVMRLGPEVPLDERHNVVLDPVRQGAS
jgi:cardiolipin synthase (CMP-forming)